MHLRNHLLAFALACAALLAFAPQAFAHALLEGTSPATGAVVKQQPTEVIFKFNQAVGGTLGAVRVYDAQGNEVDNLDVSHPDGNQHWMGVGLKPGLPDGTYTGTYRVISADTHIVYGGLVFSIGHAGAAPSATVAQLIGRNETGEVTKLAFGAVRALDYLSLALFVGGLAFVIAAWRPGIAASRTSEPRWNEAESVFAARLWRLLLAAVALGAVVSVLGILLQGASAAGVSLWSSLKGSVIDNTLESRFGEVWGIRVLVWLALGSLLGLARALRRDRFGHSSAGEAGAASSGARWLGDPPLAIVIALACGCAYLVITPALAGHASIESPVPVFFPVDVIHVLAASVWVGGVISLLVLLPGATRALQNPERTRLLLATLARFSALALACVLAISVTGAIQAYIDVRTLEALLQSTYGVLILVKVALMLVLVTFGWLNRERLIPALRRLVGAEQPPGPAGATARRTLRSELAVMLGVFGVTAALVAYAPPVDVAAGPFSTNTTLGPLELEMTVEPARVGLNTTHLYLINAKDGTQFTDTKELTVTAKLPAKHIGPLPLQATAAGPGHYILNSAELSPGGTWELQITDRVSEFEQYSRTVKVPIH